MHLLSVVALSVVASFALCVYGIASFGDGMIFQVLLQMCNRVDSTICDGYVGTATLSLSISLFFTSPLQLFVMRKHVDWQLAIHLAIFQAIGAVVGVRILFIYYSLILPRILGAVLYSVLLQKILADVRSHVKDPSRTIRPLKKYLFTSWTSHFIVWITGFSSGLLSGESSNVCLFH
jgi:uncharacterized membrane protein YfcA